MGKLGNKVLRRIAKELYDANPQDFSSDFEANKRKLSENDLLSSKRSRNLVAGILCEVVKEAESSKV